uniref:Uncharacterized protein n=1 Tax=Rhizophora mucronata TaxID=61149 RepID=A0A2P2N6Y5_RHIMU
MTRIFTWQSLERVDSNQHYNLLRGPEVAAETMTCPGAKISGLAIIHVYTIMKPSFLKVTGTWLAPMTAKPVYVTNTLY